MKLQIDVDGVLADFTTGASTLARTLDDSVSIISCMQVPSWDWTDWPPGVEDRMWDIIKSSSDFWLNLNSIPTENDWEGLRSIILEPNNEVYFVTARPGKTTKHQTEAWLWDHLHLAPTVIMAPNKGRFAKLVNPDYSIEDNSKHAYDIGRIIGVDRSFIVDRFYNRDLHPFSAKRIYSFSEFLEKVNANV